MRDDELDREARQYDWYGTRRMPVNRPTWEAPERERKHNKMTSASAVIVAYTIIVVIAALLGLGLSFVYGGK